MFKHILVPLDATGDSAAALPLARRVALASGARLTLLRVVPDATGSDDPQVAVALKETKDLAATFDLADPAGFDLRVIPVRWKAEVPATIVATAARPGSLLVMATHGRSGLARVTRGSVAEEVLERTTAPILLLGPGDRQVVDRPLGGIVVPLDGTLTGTAALEPAAQLAHDLGSELFLLRVVVPTPTTDYSPLLGTYGETAPELCYDQAALADAQHYVDNQVALLCARGLVAQGRAVFGAPTETILELAERFDAGLIALSTHALRGQARAVLGSVADRVVREAPCPVLLLRRDAGPIGRDAVDR